MDIVHTVSSNDLTTIDASTIARMSFVYNAINDGWTVRKKKDNYVFTKPHDNRKEIFECSYLESFVTQNMNIITTFK